MCDNCMVTVAVQGGCATRPGRHRTGI